MIRKKFSGFTEQQLETISRRMGYNGPMEQFNEWVGGSKERAAELSRLTLKAKEMAEKPKQKTKGYAQGGNVTKPKPAVAQTAGTGITQTTAGQFGTKAISQPEKAITPAVAQPTHVGNRQIIGRNSGWTPPAETADPAVVSKVSTADRVKTQDANTYTADRTRKDVFNASKNLEGAEGELSNKSLVKAATALPSANATVQGQLEKLMADFEGGATPPWAAGAMRKVNAIMSARGLGASSMAGSAITQAAMESAIQIAVQDASTFSQFEMQNLNNRQQARLQNAQAFLEMDMANLSNDQEMTMFKAQARIQSLFTDAAAINASRQFNATSQNQTDQFFAQLQTQVSQFNANQKNAIRQFNAENKTAARMFNAEQRNARDQFNATNRLIIDQSNAEWRRQIATQDNANLNEANRINAQLATGLTTAAYNNIWQTERDLMAYAFTAAENANERAHQVVLQKLSNEAAEDIAKDQRHARLGEAAGSLIGSIVQGIFR